MSNFSQTKFDYNFKWFWIYCKDILYGRHRTKNQKQRFLMYTYIFHRRDHKRANLEHSWTVEIKIKIFQVESQLQAKLKKCRQMLLCFTINTLLTWWHIKVRQHIRFSTTSPWMYYIDLHFHKLELNLPKRHMLFNLRAPARQCKQS